MSGKQGEDDYDLVGDARIRDTIVRAIGARDPRSQLVQHNVRLLSQALLGGEHAIKVAIC